MPYASRLTPHACKEKLTRFSNHDGSLLRQQAGAAHACFCARSCSRVWFQLENLHFLSLGTQDSSGESTGNDGKPNNSEALRRLLTTQHGR